MRKLGIALPAMLALSALLGSPASANIPVGAPTQAVAINHTTGLAYVGAGVADCACAGSLIVIDTATDLIVTTIPTVRAPTQIAVDEERNQIFAAHITGGGVSVIDGNTNTVLPTLLSGGFGLAVDPVRDRLYSTLVLGGMAVYDLKDLAFPPRIISHGVDWRGVAVNPVTNRIYVAIFEGAVSVLDGETENFADVVPPIAIGVGEGRFGITVDIARNLVYVPRYASAGRILVINGASNTIAGVAGAGSFPTALALDAAHGRLYSADRNSGTVSVLSTQGALTFLSTISVGGTPTGVAVPTRGPGRLYVTNSLSGDVTVIPLNAPPTMISATIAPTSPDTDDVLTVTVVAQDPDGDPITYSYQWTKNGADIAGATGATLALGVSGNGDHGDAIAVRVTASDGSATSVPLTSAAVTVVNSSPAVISTTIAPTSPDTDDVLTATVVAQDLDGDPLTYSYQWTKGGNEIPGATGATLDLAVSGNGDRDDTIAVRVTASDGSATSVPLTSAAVTVVNSSPTMISATIAPTSPHTDDVLTATPAAQDPDGDPLTYLYQWTKGGADIAGANGATLDLRVSGNGDRGDAIAVRVTASDGSATSVPLTSAAVTVVNSAPAVISATIAPTSPDTDDLLTATVVAQDLDGDPLDYSYVWTKVGIVIPEATGATLDLGVSGYGDHGDVIAVRVTASDGSATSVPLTSAAVTVVNSAPALISATIAPTSPDTDDVLTVTPVAQDPDGDPLTYSYQWTKGGIDILGATGATLDLGVSGNGDRGDAIAVRVTASDGSATSNPLTSASVTVVNSAPAVTSATIAPTSPDTDDVLTATGVAHDLDGDPLTYSYQWTKNGAEITGAIGATLDLAGNGDRGDQIAVRVTASDGSATSVPLTSASVTVVNSAPSMISATIAPTSPDTDDVLTVTVVAQDPDGDPLTYSYQWTKGGIDIPGATGATLNLGVSGDGDRGDAIAVRVTASDASATSNPLTSAAVTVVNSAPSASVTLTPVEPSHKALLTANVAVSDADQDSVMLTYVWRVNGEVRRTVTMAATSDQFDLSLARNGSPHDTITVTVTPNDSFTDGAAVTATAIVMPGN